MKTILSILCTTLISFSIYGQSISGSWYGVLQLPKNQLRVVLNIVKTSDGYSATMDSPDQGVRGMPVKTIKFESDSLTVILQSPKVEYKGVLGKDNIIMGNFKEAGNSFPLNLSTQVIGAKKIVRPQDPSKPYPYYAEDVTFENKTAGITLAGTLTLPKKEGIYPVVVLITGSGAQNRDEEILDHKPFLVIADYLTRNGIGVFRFDDRGTALSSGDFAAATTADFATDVIAAVNYLQTRKEIDKNNIGLAGHSEGGIIAPMVAAKLKNIHFIILLAGSGVAGDQILLQQQILVGRAAGVNEADLQKINLTNAKCFNLVKTVPNQEELKKNLTSVITESLKDVPDSAISEGSSNRINYINSLVAQLTNPWAEYFIKYDPSITLEKVKCAVLAIDGSKDFQVSPKENLDAIKKALEKGGNKNITIKEYPNLNHLFQECKTGSPNEYVNIDQTISPLVLADITSWIKKQIQ